MPPGASRSLLSEAHCLASKQEFERKRVKVRVNGEGEGESGKPKLSFATTVGLWVRVSSRLLQQQGTPRRLPAHRLGCNVGMKPPDFPLTTGTAHPQMCQTSPDAFVFFSRSCTVRWWPVW